MSFETFNFNNQDESGRIRRRPEMTDFANEEIKQQSPESSSLSPSPVFCSSCQEPGHSRRTHKRCRYYASATRIPSSTDATHGTSPETSASTSQSTFFSRNMDSQKIGRRPDVIPHITRHDAGTMSVQCSHCKAMLWLNERSNKSISNPEFQLCCGKGKYVVKQFSATPPMVARLLQSNDAISKEFKLNIRAYNNALSFTSLGVKLDSTVQNRVGGAYTFRIHGNVYHRISTSLEPSLGDAQPKFAQIYIFDAANELKNRHAVANHVSIETLSKLQDLMHEINPYVHDFKTMADLDRETPGGMSDISMVFKSECTPDPRRYNSPTTNTEIGVLIIDEDQSGEQVSHRDIVIHLKNNNSSGQETLKSINEINQHYDPMHYVLLFPRGESGWNIETRTADGTTKVSTKGFYSFHLMYRPPPSPNDETWNIHLFGSLFHQYIVDMYAKMEQQRLAYIRRNQDSLRADLYKNLCDAVENDDHDLNILGRKVILPSSFVGSPRHMAQLYQDAMSIVRKFGKPDLFVTFTCNPKWPEIQRELMYGQQAGDRPDLCCRVFNLKLKSLLDELTKQQVLGKVIAYIYTVEFQKRGLPHAHILLILDRNDKIHERDIDRLISAEIPDEASSPLLYQTVTSNMMHGPCGAMFPKSPCMKDGKCSKEFPKKFCNETSFPESNSSGYPKYKRRDNGKNVFRNGVPLDNRWVVPYNPYLSIKYNAHVNVEICASFVSVKYVYKYVYKGHDRAQVSVENQDEVQKFVDARYVSAPEACWRLFSFHLHAEWPLHTRLNIHLPDEQPVYFNADTTDIYRAHESGKRDTTLTGWFKANSKWSVARQYLYTEFPDKFVWDKSKREWKIRQRCLDTTIGRIYAVSPKDVEKYCMRMLLHHVKGATSFDDLKTVDGVLHNSFREAACAMHLLEDDKEWKKCLEEACSYKLPSTLRDLFVIIIVFNMPANPYALWSQFRDYFVEDYLYKRRDQLNNQELLPDQFVYDCGLCDIEERLQRHDLSLNMFNGFELPSSDPRNLHEGLLTDEQNNEPREIREHLLLNSRIAQEPPQEFTFNEDQKAIYDHVMNMVTSDNVARSRVVFVDGPGGTGKTYLFNAMVDTVRRNVGIAITVAASGTAALLLKGGKTAHSAFKIPFNCHGDSICSVKPVSSLGRLIRQTKLIVWDEASMISRNILEAVDRTFKEVCKLDDPSLEFAPFGGRVIVFGGDFRQVLPVIPKATRSQIVSQCISRSFLWNAVVKMNLRTNMRVQTAVQSNNPILAQAYQDFAEYLLQIGNGNIPYLNGHSAIKVDDKLLISGTNVSLLTNIVYHNFKSSIYLQDRKQFLINRAILTPLNSTVTTINDILLEEFDGEEHTLLSADKLCNDDNNDSLRYPIELLNKIDSGSLPPHSLKLKVGCPIMLLRNLDASKGLCNGTRLFCLSISSRVILAEIATGRNIGDVVPIPRIKLESNEDQLGIHFSRLQFPVRPAFAMTINKSQGQTLDFVGLYLPSPVFSHGQLYVAMSRVKTPHSLKILIDHPSAFSHSTDNVVYKEVLE